MIHVEELKKSYGAATPLKSISVDVARGEIVSIIGQSGVGKSTFLRCLNGLEKPDAGRIWIDGVDLLAPSTDPDAIRRKVGMVFQSFNLFPHLMIVENVMLAPERLLSLTRQEAYDDAMRLLRSVGLGEKALCYPDELSGGQQQRAAIARALAMKPDIILFDEPTSALDPTMAGEVLAVIRRLAAEGLTMLIVTHMMQFARDVSTRVLYFDEGVVYEAGTPEEIFEHPKRAKTRAFVQRIQSFAYTAHTKDFDFLALNSAVEAFGQSQSLTRKRISAMQLIFEELALNLLLPALPNENFLLTFTASYARQNDSVQLEFRYPGASFDPLPAHPESLSAILIARMTSAYSHSFEDGVNTILCRC